MKRALIVTYDFPPVGGSGVQRVASFARYLPEHGWQPVVLTTRKGRPIPRDHSLLAGLEGVETRRVSAPNPYRYLLRIRDRLGTGTFDSRTETGDLSRGPWHPAAWLIPDAKLPWMLPGLIWAVRRPGSARTDLVLSSLPTPTAAILGDLVARIWQVPHVIDYRDPWTGGHYLPRRLAPLRALEAAWEHRILSRATAAVHVPGVRELLPATGTPLFLLHNGYDEGDFRGVAPCRPKGDCVIAHVGLLFKGRDLGPLIDALRLLHDGNRTQDIHFLQIGRHDRLVAEQLESLSRYVRVTALPELPHREAIAHMLGADLLYLPVSHDHVPGKTYEYLRSGRPIIAVGPRPGHLRALLAETGRGEVFERTDIGRLAARIRTLHGVDRATTPPAAAVQAYRRSALTGHLAEILDATLGGRTGRARH